MKRILLTGLCLLTATFNAKSPRPDYGLNTVTWVFSGVIEVDSYLDNEGYPDSTFEKNFKRHYGGSINLNWYICGQN